MKGETVVESHRARCSRKACCRKHIVNKKEKKKTCSTSKLSELLYETSRLLFSIGRAQ